jgi:ferredoxin
MSTRLHVDWTRCEARGLCLELLPELLRGDDWGYPMAASKASPVVPPSLLDHAEAAVRECPRLALRLVRDGVDARSSQR